MSSLIRPLSSGCYSHMLILLVVNLLFPTIDANRQQVVVDSATSATSSTPEMAAESDRDLTVFDNDGDRIWNISGYDAEPNKYKWFAHFDQVGCGGTLISENWVLSAAHCDYPPYGEGNTLKGKTIRINPYFMNASNPDDTGIIRECEEVFRHPLYLGTGFTENGMLRLPTVNDLVLCKLNASVTLDKDGNEINPIKIKLEYQEPSQREATAIGLGSIFDTTNSDNEQTGAEYPKILQETTLPIIANNAEECGQEYLSAMLCTYKSKDGRRDGDACGGDSGGPLFFEDGNDEYHQVGVVSWGPFCASSIQGRAGFWNRVSSGRASNNAFEWIHNTICDDTSDPATRDPIICTALDTDVPTDMPTESPTDKPSMSPTCPECQCPTPSPTYISKKKSKGMRV